MIGVSPDADARPQTGGKLQVLPNDVYVIDAKFLTVLTEQGISYEVIEQK